MTGIEIITSTTQEPSIALGVVLILALACCLFGAVAAVVESSWKAGVVVLVVAITCGTGVWHLSNELSEHRAAVTEAREDTIAALEERYDIDVRNDELHVWTEGTQTILVTDELTNDPLLVTFTNYDGRITAYGTNGETATAELRTSD